MLLKTPSFWYDPSPSWLAYGLSPLSALYQRAHKLRIKAATPYVAPVPVICVGNFVVGGSGKTPVARALMKLVHDNQTAESPAFLTRGYGGARKGPVAVTEHDSYKTVGDEALLLNRDAQAYIARHRAEGARQAVRDGCDVIIMDDGLQNPTIAPSLRLAVIDTSTGFGNGRLFPAGPLRESPEQGFSRTDAFVLTGDEQELFAETLPRNKPVFKATIQVPPYWIADTKSPYVAFAGLAHPDKFKTTLAEKNINLVSWHPFADHYRYTDKDLDFIRKKSIEYKARIITTEKDAVRLPALFLNHNPVDVMPVEVDWSDEAAITKFLEDHIKTFS